MSKSARRGLVAPIVAVMVAALAGLGLTAAPASADTLIATQVTATSVPTSIDEGSTFDVSGAVTYNPSGDTTTFVPLEGAHVSMTFGGGHTYYATTDGAGDYTIVADGFASTFAITNIVVVLDLDATPNGSTLAASQSAPFDLPVARQITTTDITAQLAANLALNIDVQLNSSFNGGVAGAAVIFQFADDGKTWHTYHPTKPFTTDANGHFRFTGYDNVPNDYFRFSFAGDSAYQASTSNVFHVHRTATRIIHLNASPEPVTKNHKVTVKGIAERRKAGRWVTLNHQEIQYFFRRKGHKAYHYKGYSISGAHGHFSRKITARYDGYWSAVWFTLDSTPYEDAFSSEDYVNVR